MVKRLSEQLADLSVRAKNAEDVVAAAQKEAHDKIVVRKEQARAAATKAVETVNQEIKSAGNTVAGNLNAVRVKVDADLSTLKAGVAQVEHNLDVKRAETRAERLEWEAGFAIDYAIASVEQARLATLDAIVGRVEAEQAKQSPAARARSAVETLIARLRGRDMPNGIVKSNGRIEATEVDVAAKYPGRLATLILRDQGHRALSPKHGRSVAALLLAAIA